MKSIVNIKTTSQKYPKLRITKDGKLVLFLENRAGTVLATGKSPEAQPIGYFSTCWDDKSFTDFAGEVTLSNY